MTQCKINTNYPGHLGLEIGKIKSIADNQFTAILSEKVSNRDGIMILASKSTTEPIKLSVNILKQQGNTYVLKGSIPQYYEKKIFKISNHNKHLKEAKLV